jgi:hypothetical protein
LIGLVVQSFSRLVVYRPFERFSPTLEVVVNFERFLPTLEVVVNFERFLPTLEVVVKGLMG